MNVLVENSYEKRTLISTLYYDQMMVLNILVV